MPGRKGLLRSRIHHLVEQWRQPVVYQSSHRQPGGCLLDTVDIENLSGDAIKVICVTGNDMHQQVGDPAQAVHLNNFRYITQSVADAAELALSHDNENEGSQGKSEAGRVNTPLKGLQNTLGFQPCQP